MGSSLSKLCTGGPRSVPSPLDKLVTAETTLKDPISKSYTGTYHFRAGYFQVSSLPASIRIVNPVSFNYAPSCDDIRQHLYHSGRVGRYRMHGSGPGYSPNYPRLVCPSKPIGSALRSGGLSTRNTTAANRSFVGMFIYEVAFLESYLGPRYARLFSEIVTKK